MSKKRKKQHSHSHPQAGAAHGEPIAWDPQGPRKRNGILFVLGGGFLIALGAVFWTRGRSSFDVPVPQDFEAADADLREVLDPLIADARAKPADATAVATLAIGYEANRLWAPARACYERAAALEPASPLWPHHAAVCAFYATDGKGALELVRDVTVRFPTYFPGQYFLGDLLLDNGDLDGARAAFEAVVASAPQSPEGYAGLGDVLLRKNELEAARTNLERAIALDTNYKAPHFLLGRVLQKLGQEERAQHEMQIGADEQKRRMGDPVADRLGEFAAKIDTQIDRASALIGWKRYAQAEELLHKILARRKDDPRALMTLGACQLQMGKPADALVTFERAQQVLPDETNVYVQLAICNLALQRPRDAQREAERALALSPDSAQANFLMSQSLFFSGEREQALPWMETASRLVPNDAMYAGALVVLYKGLGKLDRAIEASERVVALMPERWEPLADVAQFRAQAGEFDLAEQALAKARAIAPEEPALASLADEIARQRGK